MLKILKSPTVVCTALVAMQLLVLAATWFGELFFAAWGMLSVVFACVVSGRCCCKEFTCKQVKPLTCRIVTISLLGFLLIAYSIFRWPVLRGVQISAILAGFEGRMYCSGIFVSGRTEAQVRDFDWVPYWQSFGPAVIYNRVKVDHTAKAVSVTVCDVALVCNSFTWQYYGPGFGCHLASGYQSGAQGGIKGTILAKEDFRFKDVPARSGAVPDTAPLPRNLDGDVNGYSRSELNELMTKAFEDPSESGTFALMAWVDGAVVLEGYADVAGVNQSTPLHGWSMTKTLGALLLGLSIGEGNFQLSDYMADAVSAPELSHDEVVRRNLTANSLMRMRVGTPLPEENFEIGGNAANERMLFTSADFAHFAAKRSRDLQVQATPWNADFYYASGSTLTYARGLRHFFEDDMSYWSELRNEIFLPIGATSMSIETDATGTLALSSFGYGTAEDWLRVGILILNDGVWNGKRLLPAGWVNSMRQPFTWRDCDIDSSTGESKNSCHYGGGIWRNDDGVSLQGHDGQYVSVDFTRRTVWVRLGFKETGTWWRDSWRLEDVLENGDQSIPWKCTEAFCLLPLI